MYVSCTYVFAICGGWPRVVVIILGVVNILMFGLIRSSTVLMLKCIVGNPSACRAQSLLGF